MSRDLWIVIPVGPRLHYIDDVVRNSQIASDKIIIVKDKQTQRINGAVNLDRPDQLNIQIWWNIGIDFAESQGARYVAILSDDVKLIHGQLQGMLLELIQSNVAMISSKINKKYGWGHAFIIDLQSGIRPDNRFNWYYGDYDLKYQAQRRGGFKTSSQEIIHLEPGKLTNKDSELKKLALQDKKVFMKKYPVKSFLVWMFSRILRAGNRLRINPLVLIRKFVDKIKRIV